MRRLPFGISLLLIGLVFSLTNFAYPEMVGGVAQNGKNLAPSTNPSKPNQPVQGVMLTIGAGSFWMGCSSDDTNCHGNEKPLHRVYLSTFEIDQSEVTNTQYADCVQAKACLPPAASASVTHLEYFNDPAYANYPVMAVTWYQARDYCTWAGKRLPTEAEWEKAARDSNDTRIYPWGNSPVSCTHMNYMPGFNNFCIGDATPVETYTLGTSPYGLFEMAGNVWEWVADWYDKDYFSRYPITGWPANPAGPSGGELKVIRGGGWDIMAQGNRVSRRQSGLPYDLDTATGFRCARTPAGVLQPGGEEIPPGIEPPRVDYPAGDSTGAPGFYQPSERFPHP